MITPSHTIGRHIRKMRADTGLLQSDVAAGMRALGFPWYPSRVVYLESGRMSLKLEESIALCQVLGKPLPELLQDGSAEWTAAICTGARGARRAEMDPADDFINRRLGRQFDRTPVEIDQAARLLWGKTFTAEREHRLASLGIYSPSLPPPSPRTLQAKRGHMARALARDLARHFGGAR